MDNNGQEKEKVHQVYILSQANNCNLKNTASQQDQSTEEKSPEKEHYKAHISRLDNDKVKKIEFKKDNLSNISQFIKELNHEEEHQETSISKSKDSNLKDFASQQDKSKDPSQLGKLRSSLNQINMHYSQEAIAQSKDKILEQNILLDTKHCNKCETQGISQEGADHANLKGDLEHTSISDDKADLLLKQELTPMAILGFTKQLIQQEQNVQGGCIKEKTDTHDEEIILPSQGLAKNPNNGIIQVHANSSRREFSPTRSEKDILAKTKILENLDKDGERYKIGRPKLKNISSEYLKTDLGSSIGNGNNETKNNQEETPITTQSNEHLPVFVETGEQLPNNIVGTKNIEEEEQAVLYLPKKSLVLKDLSVIEGETDLKTNIVPEVSQDLHRRIKNGKPPGTL